ncbi:DUF6076 domain-containing protein [Paenibacillus farraposensis]|uniref:DUF6076 domain-containing protein n=1 Tax=Paenibacillus farraposensis TaxID=2807095 RepID=A0ABW4D6K6_9BACL|nr:DUF6076 domain-containing protein [Paenibacillus farraposensis]MCC3381772.1 hypothetical protein [Paenibacillus farraposensis]
MSYTFEIYIADGQEHFLHGPAGHIKHTHYPLSQSVLEWMELDVKPIYDITERLQTDLQQLATEKIKRLEKPIMEGLALLNSYHPYFAYLRLEWTERLKQARQQAYVNMENMLASDELIQLPKTLEKTQKQLRVLWNDVLDVDVADEPIQGKLSRFYTASSNSSPRFAFGSLQLRYALMEEGTFTEVLKVRSLLDMPDFFVRECLRRELPFRICKNCGRYFVLSRNKNAEYCERPFAIPTKTCKEIGALNQWERKKADSPALKAYTREYKRRFAWIRYGKTTEDIFYQWAELAKLNRDACLRGEITVEAFLEWLKMDM